MKRWSQQDFTEALRDLGVSLEQFSRVSGIPYRTLYSYSTGERRIPKWFPQMVKYVQLVLQGVIKDGV